MESHLISASRRIRRTAIPTDSASAKYRPQREAFRAAIFAGMLLLLSAITPLARGELVTYFNFNEPDRAQSDGGQSATLSSDFTGVFTSPGTSLNALFDDPPGDDITLFSGEGGVNNGRSIQFSVSTIGLTGLVLTYATLSSEEGFAVQTLSYSVDGVAFTEVGFVTPPQGAFGLRSFDLTSIAEIENKPSVTLRLTFTQGSTTNVFHNNRLDNFQLVGQASPNKPGKYRGLIEAPTGDPDTPSHVGLAELTLTPTGRFSGVLQLGGKKYRLKGSLDSDGFASFGKKGSTLPLPRSGSGPLLLRMLTGPAGQITGKIQDAGADFAQVHCQRDAYSRQDKVPATLLNPAVDKGNYTAVFAAQPAPNGGLSAAQFPQGDGWAVLRAKATGAIKMRGQLADGTKFIYSTGLNAANEFPFYVPLYARKGAVFGTIVFSTAGTTQLQTTGLGWFRPAQTSSPLYPNGWPDGIALGFDGASRNVVTEPDVLPLGPATLSLTGGNLTVEIAKTVNIQEGNRVTVADPNDEKFTIHLKSNGQWNGSFIHPISGKRAKVQGVVLRHRNEADGFFLGQSESGLAKIQPQP